MPTPSTAYGTPGMNFNGTPAPLNFRHKRADIVLGNGNNNNIARNDSNYLRITGPSGAFSISGFDTPLSGMMLYVQVAISQQLTIKNKSLSSVKNQIDTLTNADVVVTATPCVITFIYDGSEQKWVYGGLQAKTAPTGTATSALSLIGKYLHNATTSWGTYQQAMLGDYLFMVDPSANASLVCYDASDIHHLVFISSLAITNLSFSGLVGAGKYLYCWSGTVGAKVFNVVDASNPYAMTVVGTLALGTRVFWGGHASVWSRSGSTYVTYTSTTGAVATNQITTINVTTPATPTLTGNYAIAGGDYAMAQDVDGRYVYVGTNQGNFKILDYSTPATPTVTGSVSIGAVNPNGDVIARQDYAYVSYADTILPINVSNPASPVIGTGFLADPTGTGMEAQRMMLSGSYLVSLVAGGSDYGLTVYQIVTPGAPTYLARYDDFFLKNFGTGAALFSIFVKDRFVYGAGVDESLNGALFVFGF